MSRPLPSEDKACTSLFLSKTPIFGTFWQIRQLPVGRFGTKVSKGISRHQDLSFEPKIECLGLSVPKIWPVQASFERRYPLGHFGKFDNFRLVDSVQKYQKAHLEIQTFHLNPKSNV